MIDQFKNEYSFLSNFWPARVMFKGVYYPSVEHAYQAAKSTDRDIRKMIREAATPGEAKRLGRAIVRAEHLDPDWETVKVGRMADFVSGKFRDPTLRRLLVHTAPEPLVEGNTWGDEFWGVDLKTGRGLNMLGSILMIERGRAILTDR